MNGKGVQIKLKTLFFFWRRRKTDDRRIEEKEEKQGLNNQTVQTKVIRNNGNIYLINIEYHAEVQKFAAILLNK